MSYVVLTLLRALGARATAEAALQEQDRLGEEALAAIDGIEEAVREMKTRMNG